MQHRRVYAATGPVECTDSSATPPLESRRRALLNRRDVTINKFDKMLERQSRYARQKIL